jgi:hypothetical protein
VDWTVMHVAGLWGYLGALLVYHTHASKADNERCVFWLSAYAHDTYALRDALELSRHSNGAAAIQIKLFNLSVSRLTTNSNQNRQTKSREQSEITIQLIFPPSKT